MKFVDIIIIIALVIAIALAVFFAVRRKRRGCCGCGKDDCPYKKSRKKTRL